MPSIVIGGASGGQLIISGAIWSGRGPLVPIGGIQLRVDGNCSGFVYVALSGGVTIQSGGFPLSGGGNLDGMQLGKGDSYFIPKAVLGASGNPAIFATPDASCSGQARLYWEAF